MTRLSTLIALAAASALLTPVVVEAGPVGVRTPYDDTAAGGECIGDRPEVEWSAAERFARADREVLVVEEQRDALLLVR